MKDLRANAPIIIKRKKIVQAAAHHGGAWKVAYADFVTAMMAFFMLMWLMNATTEKQRKGIADYFSPTIPLTRVSGGGGGMFGGESIFSKSDLPQDGTGSRGRASSPDKQSYGDTGIDKTAQKLNQALGAIKEKLRGNSGDSTVADEMMKHIRTRVTDEGLIIELFDLPETPLFVGAGAATGTIPSKLMKAMITMIAGVLKLTANQVAVAGFTRSYPVVLRKNPGWDLSTNQAQITRKLLVSAGFSAARIERVTGWSDRRPAVSNPMSVRNNRLEIILLRSDRAAARK